MKDNPLYSYGRHWLTLQAAKVATGLQLPEEGRAAAIQYVVEAVLLAMAWAVVKYGAPLMRKLKDSPGATRALLGLAAAGGMWAAASATTGCSFLASIEPRVTPDDCVTWRAEVREGHAVAVGICADGRMILEWEQRTGGGETVRWRGTRHADGRTELGYYAGSIIIRWDSKSGVRPEWVPEELRDGDDLVQGRALEAGEVHTLPRVGSIPTPASFSTAAGGLRPETCQRLMCDEQPGPPAAA